MMGTERPTRHEPNGQNPRTQPAASGPKTAVENILMIQAPLPAGVFNFIYQMEPYAPPSPGEDQGGGSCALRNDSHNQLIFNHQ
jgi:hypothetical protein